MRPMATMLVPGQESMKTRLYPGRRRRFWAGRLRRLPDQKALVPG